MPQTGKPMIISTGMANAEEIQEAIGAAKWAGCKELAILQCVSGCPPPAEDFVMNLKAGDVISENAVRSGRPGYEVLPKYLPLLA
jgi:sialic acid synthase SpsE